LPELLRVNHWIVIAIVAVMIVVLLAFIEKSGA
jgi:hypothetical protein